MKKFLSILITCLLVLSGFAGCKGKDKDSSSEEKTTSSSKSNEDDGKKEGSGGIKIDFGKSGTNLKLPKDFPEDIVPLIKDANIVNVINNKDAKAMAITYTTEEDIDYVVDFYKDVMKGGEQYSEMEVEGGTILYALLEKYGVSATIVEYDGDKVSILLSVAANEEEKNDDSTNSTPDSNENGGNNSNTEEITTTNIPEQEEKSKFEQAETIDLPENYPADKYPILKGDKVTDAFVTETDTEISIYITVVSEKSLKDLAVYYEKNWGTIEEKMKGSTQDTFMISGKIGTDSIVVNGQTLGDKKTVEYYIVIYSSSAKE